MIEAISGLSWGIVGLHVLDWCAVRRPVRMQRLSDGAHQVLPDALMGTLCIVLWPLLLVTILLMCEEEADGL